MKNKTQKMWDPDGHVKKSSGKPAPQQEVLPPEGNYEVLHGGGGPTDAGYHKIDTALRCFKEYQLREVRGIVQPTAETPSYFAIGIGLHAGRARWFADKFASDKKAWERIKDAPEEDFEKQKMKVSAETRQYIHRLLKEYCEHWTLQPKPTPVVVEHLLGPAPLQQGDPFPLWRTARIDDASYYPEALNKLCIGECKSTSASINDCINEYTLHGQPMLQFLLWELATQGKLEYGPLQGVMLDIVKKGYGREKSSFARHLVTFSEHQISWFRKNIRMILRALPNIEWNTDVPRNVTACTRLIGKMRAPCQYRDLCMHGKTASIKYVMKDGRSLLSWKPSAEFSVPPWE